MRGWQLATNLWLYIHSFQEFAAELGPNRINMGVSSEESSIKLFTAGYLSHVIGHKSQADPMSLTSHSRVTLEALMSLLCDSAKVGTLEKFQE